MKSHNCLVTARKNVEHFLNTAYAVGIFQGLLYFRPPSEDVPSAEKKFEAVVCCSSQRFPSLFLHITRTTWNITFSGRNDQNFETRFKIPWFYGNPQVPIAYLNAKWTYTFRTVMRHESTFSSSICENPNWSTTTVHKGGGSAVRSVLQLLLIRDCSRTHLQVQISYRPRGPRRPLHICLTPIVSICVQCRYAPPPRSGILGYRPACSPLVGRLLPTMNLYYHWTLAAENQAKQWEHRTRSAAPMLCSTAVLLNNFKLYCHEKSPQPPAVYVGFWQEDDR